MTPEERQVVLAIADISGYTQFMISDKTSIMHKRMILTQLINTIIETIDLPLVISKLEGDAVFVYALKDHKGFSPEEFRRSLGKRLLEILKKFAEAIREFECSEQCHCGACGNVDKLRLKIIAHSGEGFFVQVGNFSELSGIDVILVHRLLKNSIDAKEYILLTEAARGDVEFPEEVPFTHGREVYDELGEVKTYVYYPTLAPPS